MQDLLLNSTLPLSILQDPPCSSTCQLNSSPRRLSKVCFHYQPKICLLQLLKRLATVYLRGHGFVKLTSFRPSAELVPCSLTTTGMRMGPSSSAAPMMDSAIMSQRVMPMSSAHVVRRIGTVADKADSPP